MGHSRQASTTTFPQFPYSRRVMIVLRRSLYGVVSDGRVLGLFIRLPPAVLTGFPQGGNISLEAGLGRIVFLSAVIVLFQLRYQSTFIPVPPYIGRCDFKGFPLTLCFLVLHAGSSPGPYTQCGIGVPSEKLLFAGGVSLDALLYYQ